MLFVTATDTDVGKTYFSKSLLSKLLEQMPKEKLAYYKPIQCGKPTDYDVIKELGIDTHCSYDLTYPASPDYAASLEGVEIKLEKILDDFQKLKAQYDFILVEGAGGLAVPINKTEMISDLAKALNLETILVIRPDLGTINHSILSLEHIKAKGLKLKGIYVSGKHRDLSLAYELSDEERSKQNSAALKSILEFSQAKEISLDEIAYGYQLH